MAWARHYSAPYVVAARKLKARAVQALRAETARRVWIQWTIVKSNFYTLCISQESQVKTKKKNKMGNGYNNMFNMLNRVVLTLQTIYINLRRRRPARSPIILHAGQRQPRRGSINVAEETVLINLQTVYPLLLCVSDTTCRPAQRKRMHKQTVVRLPDASASRFTCVVNADGPLGNVTSFACRLVRHNAQL